MLQNNEYTRKVKSNDVYDIAGYRYKVININYTKKGLLVLKCKRKCDSILQKFHKTFLFKIFLIYLQ
ncbi:ig -containing domain protein [Anoxybacillus sp. B7M1]|nr:ig -containing domain protein [Anoxybacillus sp. B2M1]ANB65239.1 ig -containing domain protein [Anoxybacillus sp. B7M1]